MQELATDSPQISQAPDLKSSRRGILEFIRSQIASLAATAVDYAFFIVCFRLLGVYYVFSSAVGNIAGGLFHFTVSRFWVFHAKDEKIPLQASKYIVISATSAVLNSGLIYCLKEYLHIREEYAKLLSALTIGMAINFPLFKFFVFQKNKSEGHSL